MNMEAGKYLYFELDKAWKGACKVVLGDEIGELKEYESWLEKGVPRPKNSVSSLSKKETYLYSDKYCKNCKVLSFEEVDFNKKYSAIDLNKIKDLDSIINELQDRTYYTGNVVLGNCKYVEKSTNVFDSWYVYDSFLSNSTKATAYSYRARINECTFGTDYLGEAKYSIKCSTHIQTNRTLETHLCAFSSDIFYSHNITDCADCMFCFNLRAKKHCIGNLELEKGKYLELKKKLLDEIRQQLKKEKKLPSLFEIVKDCGKPSGLIKEKSSKKDSADLKYVENAFRTTSKTVLGTELREFAKYQEYLMKNNEELTKAKSAFSGKPLHISKFTTSIDFAKDRIINEDEVESAGNLNMDKKEIENMAFKNLSNALKKIAYFCPEWKGSSKNCNECIFEVHSLNCHHLHEANYTKNSAFGMFPRECENVFGCGTIFGCIGCINCYESKNLNRCFECDSCESCTDLYFSHNCENVHDSMFCFNIKNKRNAIGNVEYSKEQYLQIKKMLLEQIGKELEKNKDFKWSIYNIGCYKK